MRLWTVPGSGIIEDLRAWREIRTWIAKDLEDGARERFNCLIGIPAALSHI